MIVFQKFAAPGLCPCGKSGPTKVIYQMYYTKQDSFKPIWSLFLKHCSSLAHNFLNNNLDNFSNGNKFLRMHLQNLWFSKKPTLLYTQRGRNVTEFDILTYCSFTDFLGIKVDFLKMTGCLVKLGSDGQIVVPLL